MTEKPNILMLHRINLNNGFQFNQWYAKRKMIISIAQLFELIDSYLQNGFQFGSIEQTLNSKKFFHIVFDDGFKEHLKCAKLLKQKYQMQYEHLTFSVNIGNSYLHKFSGMDIIYLVLSGNAEKLFNYLKISKDTEIEELKQIYASLSPKQLDEISDIFEEFHDDLSKQYLNTIEVNKLSELFQIASHGISHRFLTKHKDISKLEIKHAKEILEQKLNNTIDIFCYPEGKNDKIVQDYVNAAGFKYALSIRHEPNNNFCIGRIIK